MSSSILFYNFWTPPPSCNATVRIWKILMDLKKTRGVLTISNDSKIFQEIYPIWRDYFCCKKASIKFHGQPYTFFDFWEKKIFWGRSEKRFILIFNQTSFIRYDILDHPKIHLLWICKITLHFESTFSMFTPYKYKNLQIKSLKGKMENVMYWKLRELHSYVLYKCKYARRFLVVKDDFFFFHAG